MGTTAEKLKYLNETKAEIKNALEKESKFAQVEKAVVTQ